MIWGWIDSSWFLLKCLRHCYIIFWHIFANLISGKRGLAVLCMKSVYSLFSIFQKFLVSSLLFVFYNFTMIYLKRDFCHLLWQTVSSRLKKLFSDTGNFSVLWFSFLLSYTSLTFLYYYYFSLLVKLLVEG